MSDLIRRQDAIDALEKVAELYPWRVPGDRDSYSKYNEAWNDALDRADSEIEALPSAQPERETAKFIRWMECKKTANYISYTPHCKCSKCGTEFLIATIKYCYMCGARMEGE